VPVTRPVLVTVRNEYTAVAGVQVPTSVMPSPFQSPVTGRSEKPPKTTVRVTARPSEPSAAPVRSVNEAVDGS
jgi:hypothetical protein